MNDEERLRLGVLIQKYNAFGGHTRIDEMCELINMLLIERRVIEQILDRTALVYVKKVMDERAGR